MEMEKNDGGPAFPVVSDGAMHGTEPGMSLRDYFAAKAMNGMAGVLTVQAIRDMADGIQGAAILSRASYVVADAMLAARD